MGIEFSLVQEQRTNDTQGESAMVKSQQQGVDDYSQRLPEVREPPSAAVCVCMDHAQEIAYIHPAEEERE